MSTENKQNRLLSLDVFRGITIAGMVLVNNPGTWSAIYPPLEHAEWNGLTPTDLVFRSFYSLSAFPSLLLSADASKPTESIKTFI